MDTYYHIDDIVGNVITSSNTPDTAYDVDEMVRQGDFGSVYQAYRKPDNRLYAMKVIAQSNSNHRHANGPRHESLQHRIFHKNATRLMQIRHQYILNLEDFARFRTHNNKQIFACFFMHFAQGDLEHAFVQFQPGRAGRMTMARFVGYQMSAALDYLHSQNMIHSNLKPGNILYFRDAERSYMIHFKLADFGLPRPLLQHVERLVSSSTQAYVAPEVAAHNTQPQLATKLDIYSLGKILFNIITDNIDDPSGNSGYIPYKANVLVREMIRLNAKRRPSAATCLRHFWIREGNCNTGLDTRGLCDVKSHGEYNSDDDDKSDCDD
jgi:serine/threonine protein kinase